jgi:hypothetical protein
MARSIPMAMNRLHPPGRAPPSGVDFLDTTVELSPLVPSNVVRALTEATGSSDYPFVKERGIERAIEKLGAEVHSQYILNFAQRENATGSHQIDVSVPSRGDLRIHWRRACWARTRTSDTPKP